MKKAVTKKKRPVRSFKRFTVVAVAAVVILAIGAISVLSRQRSKGELKAQMAAKTQTVTSRMTSQDGHLDAQSQAQDLSADDEQKLANGLHELVNQSTEGLVEVKHADGTVSVDLEGRFQNVTVARVNKDGSVSTSCVDNPRSAGAFFGIDPKLIDPTVDSNGAKPIKSPARNRN